MTQITVHREGDKEIYSSPREVIALYPNIHRQAFKSLDISLRMQYNLNIFWSKKTLQWVQNVSKLINQISEEERKLTVLINEEPHASIFYRKFVPQLQDKIKRYDDKLIDTIQSYLKQNQISELNDIFSQKKLIQYKEFFDKDVWFELLIFFLFEKLELKDAREIFSCYIVGKSGLRHEIDTTVITPMHTTIVEAKSSQAARSDLLKLIGQKTDINADIAFLITVGSYTEKKFKDDYRNVFVYDKVLDKKFDELLAEIREKYSK